MEIAAICNVCRASGDGDDIVTGLVNSWNSVRRIRVFLYSTRDMWGASVGAG